MILHWPDVVNQNSNPVKSPRSRLSAAGSEVSELERKAQEHDSEAASRELSAEIAAKQRLEKTLTEYRATVAR